MEVFSRRVADITKYGYEKIMKSFTVKLIGFTSEFRIIKGRWEYSCEVKLIMLTHDDGYEEVIYLGKEFLN